MLFRSRTVVSESMGVSFLFEPSEMMLYDGINPVCCNPYHTGSGRNSFHDWGKGRSIGVILSCLGQGEAFLSFVEDTLIDGAVNLVRLQPEQMTELIETASRLGLDFDDAYQYLAATTNGLRLISFDGDFDGTPFGENYAGPSASTMTARNSCIPDMVI